MLTSPEPKIREGLQRMDDLEERFYRGMRDFLGTRRENLEAVSRLFDSLSPLRVLERGYSLTTREATGEVVFQAGQVRNGEKVRVRLARGALRCEVLPEQKEGS